MVMSLHRVIMTETEKRVQPFSDRQILIGSRNIRVLEQ